MSWQPASNGRLAGGVADIPAIRAAGMPLGVGLDDQACTDIADPWQNMRIGMYQLRALTDEPSVMSPVEMLRLHTLGSYVLACGLRNLRQVYVDGELVAEDGVSLNPLAAEASARPHEQLPRIAAEHGWPA